MKKYGSVRKSIYKLSSCDFRWFSSFFEFINIFVYILFDSIFRETSDIPAWVFSTDSINSLTINSSSWSIISGISSIFSTLMYQIAALLFKWPTAKNGVLWLSTFRDWSAFSTLMKIFPGSCCFSIEDLSARLCSYGALGTALLVDAARRRSLFSEVDNSSIRSLNSAFCAFKTLCCMGCCFNSSW